LNLLDWSAKGQLAIGLEGKVYLYCPQNIDLLCEKEEDNYVCSLAFHPQGDLLAVGLASGKTEIYDVERKRVVYTLKGHTSRVSSSAYTYGLLYTGSRDTKIIGHDVRSPHNVVAKF
jgi:cell division cycle protein 20 (cofactor of APC complex)